MLGKVARVRALPRPALARSSAFDPSETGRPRPSRRGCEHRPSSPEATRSIDLTDPLPRPPPRVTPSPAGRRRRRRRHGALGRLRKRRTRRRVRRRRRGGASRPDPLHPRLWAHTRVPPSPSRTAPSRPRALTRAHPRSPLAPPVRFLLSVAASPRAHRRRRPRRGPAVRRRGAPRPVPGVPRRAVRGGRHRSSHARRIAAGRTRRPRDGSGRPGGARRRHHRGRGRARRRRRRRGGGGEASSPETTAAAAAGRRTAGARVRLPRLLFRVRAAASGSRSRTRSRGLPGT